MKRQVNIAIFGDEEPVAIHWPDVVAIEYSHFYEGTRVVFRENGDTVIRGVATADVIEAWHDWMGMFDV